MAYTTDKKSVDQTHRSNLPNPGPYRAYTTDMQTIDQMLLLKTANLCPKS